VRRPNLAKILAGIRFEPYLPAGFVEITQAGRFYPTNLAMILASAGIDVVGIWASPKETKYYAERWAAHFVRIVAIGPVSSKRINSAFRKLAARPELREAAEVVFRLGGDPALFRLLFGARAGRVPGADPTT